MYTLSLLAGMSVSPFRRILLPFAVLLWVVFLAHRSTAAHWNQWKIDDTVRQYVTEMRHRIEHVSASVPPLSQPPSINRHARPFVVPKPMPTVDVRAALTAQGKFSDELPFSSPIRSPWRTTDVELMQLGTHLSNIRFEKKRLLNGNETQRMPFNPALLKLPAGLEWDFAVVARGPIRKHTEMTPIMGKVPVEQGLIAFGANMTSSFELRLVSDAFYLPFDSAPSMACKGWSHTFGAEDPRIWWSDSNLPQLSYTQIATDGELCRTIALVRDLRAVWPELGRVLSPVLNIPPVLPRGVQDVTIELRKPRPRSIEKNWLAFFPGALPNPMQKPLFQYNLNPLVALTESNKQPSLNAIWYEPIAPPPSNRSEVCMPHFHKIPLRAVHQSVPLQRVTLCPRGTCVPDETNTVYVSLGQAKKSRKKGSGLEYGRFVITWNVTSPFEYVSVGPEFRFVGTNDEDIVYALSMVLLPSSPSTDTRHAHQPVLNFGHGFIDDDAMFGLGIGDRHMSTIVVPVKDLLSGQKMCEDAPLK